MRPSRLLMAVLLAGAASSPGAHAQEPDSGAFYVRLGTDTIAVETYVRTPQQLVAHAVLRTPQTRRYKLTVTFREDGRVAWYEVINDPVAGVPNASPVMRNVVTYLGDSAHVQTWISGQPRRTRTVPASSDMLPLQMPFYSTYEMALMAARKAGTDSMTMSMLSAVGPLPYQVRWMAPDSVTLYHPQSGIIRARVDQHGRLLGFNGEASTFKVVVTRAPGADLKQLEARYAAADAAGTALGALSPRDSVEFDVGEALAMVGYGRPAKRGRTIFGGIVPWGEVWRTGANAATQIFLTHDIEINGVPIPAGRYSLWTIPERKNWRLIVNKQTGQWGTDYDPEQDLARIEVVSQTIPVPVERFTITPEIRDDNTTILTLTWDRTRVIIPMTGRSQEDE